MPRLQCPRCETTIEAPDQGQPVCPACGFSAPYAGSGEHQESGGGGYQEETPPSRSGSYETGSDPGYSHQQEPSQEQGGYGQSQEGYPQQGYGMYSQPYGASGPGPSSQGYGGPPGGAPPGYPGGQQQPHGPYGGPPRGPPGKTSGMAVASMILGIIAICMIFIAWVPMVGLFAFIPGVVAIILGGISMSQMNKDPSLQGRGMAVAGLVLGIITAAVGLISQIFWFSLMGF